jgi:lysophospholipase L1-like esterase
MALNGCPSRSALMRVCVEDRLRLCASRATRAYLKTTRAFLKLANPPPPPQHPGWTSKQIQGLESKWVSLAPDVVLLMSGTNNLGRLQPNASAAADLGDLLAALRSSLPTARVLVTSILTFFSNENPWLPASVDAYNALIPALAAANNATFVDINSITQLCRGPSDPLAYSLCAVCNGPCGGYNPAACPSGGGYSFCHPTAAGYAQVGGAWAAALLPVLHELAGQKSS